MTEWRDISGFPSYQVSDDGQVRGPRGKMNLFPGSNTPYLRVGLMISRRRQIQKIVHRLVAEAFIPNPDNLPIVNHKDTNKRNNRKDNLEWTTYQGNMDHAVENALMEMGQDRYNAKLTDDDVRAIRSEFAETGCSKQYLANKYGISRTNVGSIISRQWWKHVI